MIFLFHNKMLTYFKNKFLVDSTEKWENEHKKNSSSLKLNTHQKFVSVIL